MEKSFKETTKIQLYKVLPKGGIKLEGKMLWKEKVNLISCIKYTLETLYLIGR
jgi:hypothetical protein